MARRGKAVRWRNLIVGHGTKRASEFIPNPLNWRMHPEPQVEALKGLLNEVGWVAPVIVDRRTGFLIDGHLRVELAKQNGDAEVPFIEIETVDDAEAGLVLATLDTVTTLAEADDDQLRLLLESVHTTDENVQALLNMARSPEPESGPREDIATKYAQRVEERYSKRVEPPVYEPTGPCPAVSDLYDDTMARELIEAVNGAEGVGEEVQAFLRAAAHRFTQFDFRAIAEFYAHADPTVQALMERLALVIPDFDRAIELGFVRLSEALMAEYRNEYGDDDGEIL